MLDVAVINGTVVTPEGAALIDLGISDGKISSLSAAGLLPEATRVIDARDMVVVPGGIDPHIHTNRPLEMDFILGREIITKAALYGGITSVIDFVWSSAGEYGSAVTESVNAWENTTFTDYGFHVVLSGDLDRSRLAQLPALIEAGFPSFKIFTTNMLPGRTGFRVPIGSLSDLFRVVARHRGIVNVHAEEDEIVMHEYTKHIADGQTSLEYMPEVHSALSEDLSFRHVGLELGEREVAPLSVETADGHDRVARGGELERGRILRSLDGGDPLVTRGVRLQRPDEGGAGGGLATAGSSPARPAPRSSLPTRLQTLGRQAIGLASTAFVGGRSRGRLARG